MKPEQRQRFLTVAAGSLVGLWLLNLIVIGPVVSAWGEQTERIEALQKKVTRGRALLEREKTIRGHWADMQRANLPVDISLAEGEAISAINRWQFASGVNLANIAPQWQAHDDAGYDDFECRASLTGNVVNVGRFIYELESDPAPVSLQECEIAARDTHGQQITMNARFSFVRLGPDAGSASATPASSSRSAAARNVQ